MIGVVGSSSVSEFYDFTPVIFKTLHHSQNLPRIPPQQFFNLQLHDLLGRVVQIGPGKFGEEGAEGGGH